MSDRATELLAELKTICAKRPLDREGASKRIELLRFRYGWDYARFAAEIPDYEAIAYELDTEESE